MGFGYPNYGFHHIWEAAATAPAFAKGVINLRRHNQYPRILSEQIRNCILDFFFCYEIAMANQHLVDPSLKSALPDDDCLTCESSERAASILYFREMRVLPEKNCGGSAAAGFHRAVDYWKTLLGASRLSDPSKVMASNLSAATARSMDFVWLIRASTAACTTALPSVLPSPICWS